MVVGRASWLREDWALVIPDALAAAIETAEGAGSTAVVIAWDGAVRGALVVGDTVKESSRQAIETFRASRPQTCALDR